MGVVSLTFAVAVEIIFIGDFCLGELFCLLIFKYTVLLCLCIPPMKGCCSDDSQSACRGKGGWCLLLVNFMSITSLPHFPSFSF